MTTLLFVHGTGVREEHLRRTVQLIKEGLERSRWNCSLAVCEWFRSAGANLPERPMSIPNYMTTRGPWGRGRDVDAGDAEVVLWAMLYEDPLWELRLVRIGADEVPRYGGLRPPWLDLDGAVAELDRDAGLAQQVARAGLADYFGAAIAHVRASDEYRGALHAAAGQSNVGHAIARALVAEGIALQVEEWLEPGWTTAELDADARDALVETIDSRLGADARGLGALAGDAVEFAKRRATSAASWGASAAGWSAATGAGWYLQPRRGRLTNAWAPRVGDVLLYQVRGEPLRDAVRIDLEAVPVDEDVILLGHSLGGVGCFELLLHRIRSPHFTGRAKTHPTGRFSAPC